MTDDQLRIWETLFQRTLTLIDAVQARGTTIANWSFGGGTVLMRRHRHLRGGDVDTILRLEAEAQVLADAEVANGAARAR